MLVARRIAPLLGLALVVAATVLMLWPLHANGLSGNAFQPHYKGFGWYSYTPPPAHYLTAYFIDAGPTPQDLVHDRRVLSAAIAAGGAVLVLATAVIRPRRRDPIAA